MIRGVYVNMSAAVHLEVSFASLSAANIHSRTRYCLYSVLLS